MYHTHMFSALCIVMVVEFAIPKGSTVTVVGVPLFKVKLLLQLPSGSIRVVL